MSNTTAAGPGRLRGPTPAKAPEPQQSERPPAFALRPVLVVAVLTGVVLLVTGARYGFHRDELYHVLLGDRLAWGYADTGPASALLSHLGVSLFGAHAWAVRVPSALLTTGTVVVVALLARELGGRSRAQVLAAAATAASAFTLIIGHVFLTTSIDEPLTLLVVLFAIRALRRADGRWWLAAGAVTGLAWYNKYVVVLTVLSLAVGLVLAGPRTVFRDRYLWGGAVAAAVVGLPNLLYQATHDFVALDMASGIAAFHGDADRAGILLSQLTLAGPLLVPVWVAGLVRLFRDRSVRAVAVAYPAYLAFMLLTGPRPDYIYPLMLVALAAGCVSIDGWWSERRVLQILVGAGFALSAMYAVLVSLPVIPAGSLATSPTVDSKLFPVQAQLVADQVGWPDYVKEVNEVYQGLPPAERAHTVILTGNYGEAGAIYLLGREYDLPAVYSGHNGLYSYGPPPQAATTVIFTYIVDPAQRSHLLPAFDRCYLAGRVSNRYQVPNEEVGVPIEVCTGLHGSWSQIWPALKHLD